MKVGFPKERYFKHLASMKFSKFFLKDILLFAAVFRIVLKKVFTRLKISGN